MCCVVVRFQALLRPLNWCPSPTTVIHDHNPPPFEQRDGVSCSLQVVSTVLTIQATFDNPTDWPIILQLRVLLYFIVVRTVGKSWLEDRKTDVLYVIDQKLQRTGG